LWRVVHPHRDLARSPHAASSGHGRKRGWFGPQRARISLKHAQQSACCCGL
jgi:hypothetical protein